MRNITYEATYATRGQSGIPKDATDTAISLSSIEEVNLNILFSSKAYTSRSSFFKPSLMKRSSDFGKAIRENSGRSLLPVRIERILSILQVISLNRNVSAYEVSDPQKQFIQEEIFKGRLEKSVKISLLPLSLSSRFARPNCLGRFRIKLVNSDIFIQQQIDPIMVSSGAKHIVRLHDILPVTHPQYFDDLAVQVFVNGFTKMLGKDIIWVMDTQASSNEFKSLFPSEKKVHVIPCVVNIPEKAVNLNTIHKTNQVVMVNTIEPRKQVQLSIDGFKLAKELGYLDSSWNFVIIGKAGWQSDDLIKNLQKNAFGLDIQFHENYSDPQIASAYQKSKIVISTSKAEGFGLPPLEGMGWGCVPVVSKIPQHVENVGKFGHYFESFDSKEVAEALRSAASASMDPSQSVLVNSMHAHVNLNFSINNNALEWEALIRQV